MTRCILSKWQADCLVCLGYERKVRCSICIYIYDLMVVYLHGMPHEEQHGPSKHSESGKRHRIVCNTSLRWIEWVLNENLSGRHTVIAESIVRAFIYKIFSTYTWNIPQTHTIGIPSSPVLGFGDAWIIPGVCCFFLEKIGPCLMHLIKGGGHISTRWPWQVELRDT